jgi:hypothetical protein
MKATNFSLLRYDADEGKVFDWAEPRFETDEEGNEYQTHLNAKTLFLGITDTIENYIEVAEDGTIEELTTPEYATENDYLLALAELGVE